MTPTIVCVGGGPSLTQQDVDYCKGRAAVMVINNGYELAPWADWLYAADYSWWMGRGTYGKKTQHVELSRSFNGERWTQWTEDDMDSDESRLWAVHNGVRGVRSYARPGLARGLGFDIHRGHNGGYQAINLSYRFGARRIVLLGYDMGATGQAHWHPPHDGESNHSPFDLFLRQFPALAVDLAAEGIEVINCTRKTALHCFPCAPLETVL